MKLYLKILIIFIDRHDMDYNFHYMNTVFVYRFGLCVQQYLIQLKLKSKTGLCMQASLLLCSIGCIRINCIMSDHSFPICIYVYINSIFAVIIIAEYRELTQSNSTIYSYSGTVYFKSL